jgi:hypothetical protein
MNAIVGDHSTRVDKSKGMTIPRNVTIDDICTNAITSGYLQIILKYDDPNISSLGWTDPGITPLPMRVSATTGANKSPWTLPNGPNARSSHCRLLKVQGPVDNCHSICRCVKSDEKEIGLNWNQKSQLLLLSPICDSDVSSDLSDWQKKFGLLTRNWWKHIVHFRS